MRDISEETEIGQRSIEREEEKRGRDIERNRHRGRTTEINR